MRLVVDVLRWMDDVTLRAWLHLTNILRLRRNRPMWLGRLATRCISRGHLKRAEEYLMESLRLSQQDTAAVGWVSSQLGYIKWMSDDMPGAEQWYERSYRADAEHYGGSHDTTIDSMYRLSSALEAQKKYKKNAVVLEELFGFLSQCRDRPSKQDEQISVASQLGNIYFKRDNTHTAVGWFRRALSLAEGRGDARTLRMALFNLAALSTWTGNPQEAESLLSRADECASVDANLDGKTMTLRVDILMAREEWDAARDLALKLKEHWKGLQKYDGVARAERSLGECLLALGAVDEGLEHLRQHLSMLLRVIGPVDPETLEAIEFVAEEHRKHGRNAEADGFYARLRRGKGAG